MMWTKLALVVAIIGGVLGWLHLHDKEVKAKALAEQRRESLHKAAQVIADKNVAIDSAKKANEAAQLVIQEKDKKLEQKETKLRQQAQSLDSLSKVDSTIIEKVKGDILIRGKTHIPRGEVFRLIQKYDDYTMRLNTTIIIKDQQIAVANLRLLEKQAELDIEKENHKLEILKNNNLASINQSLLEELNKPVEVDNSFSIWTAAKYVVPSVIVTACIVRCFK